MPQLGRAVRVGARCCTPVLMGRSTPQLLVDKGDRVVGVLAGHPLDSSWGDVVKEANRAMGEAYKACSFTAEQKDHRRGQFATLACGVSFGGGRKVRRLNACWDPCADAA